MTDKTDYKIPKVIHYFWIGRNPKPESVHKCIDSWRRNCPDFEIREWNEDNYDIHKHPYMERAYKEGKWAFVSDYGRLDVLYQYGGIYMDTDVETIKDLSPLCKYEAYLGFENDKIVNDGQGFGCISGMQILKEMMACYDGDEPYDFLNNEIRYVESPKICTKVFLRHGLKQDGSRQSVDGIEIFPVDFFCPKDYDTGCLKITGNTYSIHHFDASWQGRYVKVYSKVRHMLNRIFGIKRGKRIFCRLMRLKNDFKRMIGR